MKTLINISKGLLFTIIFVGLSYSSGAQNVPCKANEKGLNKYALLVRTSQHMGAALKTAKQLNEAGKDYEEFEVVVCGKVVKELADKSNEVVSKMLTEAERLNVRFSVCGMSMEKFEVHQQALPEQLEVVDNGLIRIFELQENCFYTIEL